MLNTTTILLIAESVAYEWLTKPGLIRYYYQMKREPDTSTDVLTLGFITPLANCVIIRVDSLGDDYMQVEVVSAIHHLIVTVT